jgi:hypothetical protein
MNPDSSIQNLLSLSMSDFGGFALFDLRQGSKTTHMTTLNAIKTSFYASNPNYLSLLTKQGSLELYDLRNLSGGPVNIFNQQFAAVCDEWKKE